MNITVESNVDTGEILFRRGLGKGNNLVNKFIASDVRRLCDSYVPFSRGPLKNTAQISSDGQRLTYIQRYAHLMYVGEVYGPNYPLKKGGWISGKAPKKPTGRRIKYHGAPMRGAHWDKRMMADHRQDVERDTKGYIGSLVK